MKILTLVSLNGRNIDQEEEKKLEQEGKRPRSTFYAEMLNSDMLDRVFLSRVPRSRKLFYKFIPELFAQVIEAVIIRKQYDAVVSWGEKNGVALAGLLKLLRIRHPHIGLFYWISQSKTKIALKLVKSHFDRIVLWVSTQREIAVNHVGFSPEKIVAARYLIDHLFWQSSPTVSPDMICSAGREMRDYRTLIAALEGTGIKCHIASFVEEGKNDAWIKDLRDPSRLPPEITAGSKEHVSRRELYARSRFVVVPLLESDTEHGVSVMLEAMAMSKAVICSRTKGQHDIIEEGTNGLFVPVGDPVALREAILFLWNNPGEAERMGRAARRFIETHHTIEQFVSTVRTAIVDSIAEHAIRKFAPGLFLLRPRPPIVPGINRANQKDSAATRSSISA